MFNRKVLSRYEVLEDSSGCIEMSDGGRILIDLRKFRERERDARTRAGYKVIETMGPPRGGSPAT